MINAIFEAGTRIEFLPRMATKKKPRYRVGKECSPLSWRNSFSFKRLGDHENRTGGLRGELVK